MICGKVVRGEGLARALGFPTANIGVNRDSVGIEDGVYVAQVELEKKEYNSVLVIINEPFKVEVHLFFYEGEDFYGKTVCCKILEKINDIEKFKSNKDLAKKINMDVVEAKKFFGNR